MTKSFIESPKNKPKTKYTGSLCVQNTLIYTQRLNHTQLHSDTTLLGFFHQHTHFSVHKNNDSMNVSTQTLQVNISTPWWLKTLKHKLLNSNTYKHTKSLIEKEKRRSHKDAQENKEMRDSWFHKPWRACIYVPCEMSKLPFRSTSTKPSP